MAAIRQPLPRRLARIGLWLGGVALLFFVLEPWIFGWSGGKEAGRVLLRGRQGQEPQAESEAEAQLRYPKPRDYRVRVRTTQVCLCPL